jgi:outer membrane immunogenic protein
MKKLLFATVAVLGFAGAASAADLAPIPFRPLFMPAYNWTGCYLGGYLGGAWTAETVRVGDISGYNNLAWDYWSYDTSSSILGGATAGCNWQPIGSPLVVGVEGEFGYMRMTGSAVDPYDVFTSIRASTRVGDWYGMVTGRLGYAWNRVLGYVKGGAAFVEVQTTVTDPIVNPGYIAQASQTKATWTLGGGLEWAFYDNWSVKAEYMFIGLDKTSACGANANPLVLPIGQYCWDQQLDGVHTAKIGLNYRFGGNSVPVIARY